MPEFLAKVALPATGREHHLAALRVRLEDVSRSDVSAGVLASAERTDVTVPAEGAVIDVRVPAPPPGDPRRRVNVRVHGSATGAEAIESGDFLSTAAVPLPATGSVEVPVELLP